MSTTREPLFGDDAIGRALMDLFYDCEILDHTIQGRVAAACRLLHGGRGMDSVHEMIHHDLDFLEEIPELKASAKRLRSLLLRRRLPPGAFVEK